MPPAKLTPVKPVPPSRGEAELLVAYCARPKCRSEIKRPAGRGRPKDYCSRECQLKAHDELRILRSRLERYQDVIDQIRIDIAAFGRPADDEEIPAQSDVLARRAFNALLRAEGVLTFAPETDALTGEFRAVVDAVSPLVKETVSRAS